MTARLSVRGLSVATILRAGLVLIEASIRIRAQRFDRVAEWAVSVPNRASITSGSFEDERRAVLGWCLRVPWRALCMEQGVAIARLLARRGHLATIFYGASTVDGNLEAHVWVKSGDFPIVGCEFAHQFVVLSQITNASSSSSVHPSLYKESSEES